MMGTDNRISVLRIDSGDSFDFFRIFFFLFRGWYSRRCWLLLEFIDLGLGIINLENEVVDLFLEELNIRVALGDYRITLIDLVFLVMNSLLPGSDDFFLLCHQSLKLLYLGDLSVSIPKVTLRDTDQLTHTAT
jgi:hypothetical protein